MSNHIDKAEVTVEGFFRDIVVQSFELVIAVNTIPQISLTILPIEKPTKGNGQYITASSPNIKDITELYSLLLSKAVTLDEKATLTIKHITPYDSEDLLEEEKYQTIELKDWIMSDVGLSSVTTMSAPVLSVTFSHPAIKLDRSGMIYENVENPIDLPEVYKDLEGDEIISYMDSVYDAYSSDEEILFSEIADISEGGPDDRFKEKVQEFRTSGLSENKPGKYIEGKTEKFFMEEIKPELHDDLVAMSGPIVAPQAFCKSTWNRIITEICPQFLATIIPTYDKEKLKLEPFSPWQECTYEIDTKIVSSLDVTSIDPNPIIGVAVIKDVWSEEAATDGNTRDSSGKYDKSYAFYFPDMVLDDQIPGEILNLGEPGIISNLITADEASNSVDGMSGPEGEDLESAGNHIEDEDHETLDEAYAKAMFQINYRKNCKASVVTTPMFKLGNSTTIYPGRVMTVYDPSSEARLFYGYITRIITKGSSEGGCMTHFELSHARSAYGNKSVTKLLVDEGTENPCYPIPDRSDY